MNILKRALKPLQDVNKLKKKFHFYHVYYLKINVQITLKKQFKRKKKTIIGHIFIQTKFCSLHTP